MSPVWGLEEFVSGLDFLLAGESPVIAGGYSLVCVVPPISLLISALCTDSGLLFKL